MRPGPVDVPLPITAQGVVGVWLNDTPIPLSDREAIHPATLWTILADGTVICSDQSSVLTDGESRPLQSPREHAGRWALDDESLVVDLPTRNSVVHGTTGSRLVFTLVRRTASDGETRECLRTARGGYYWRVG